MNKSILFFDIDGTILSEKTKQISESTKNAIRKARQNGHLTFINTGRTIEEIDSYILSLDFDGYVCGCGTYIEYDKKVLLSNELSQELMYSIIKDLREYRIEACLEGVNTIYFDSNSTNQKIKSVRDHMKELHFQLSDWDDSSINFAKFTIWLRHDSNYKAFYQKYKGSFDFIDRGQNFYEIVPTGFSKGTGIQFLLNHFNMNLDDAYALGDSANDIPMLSYAKNSIAMGNSDSSILPHVSFITKDVDDDGIEYALKHYCLI
jgi:Cof subfamily protein (haloacid dehalogenase superfamily)